MHKKEDLAALLTNLVSSLINSNGVFFSQVTNYYFAGPNFTFVPQPFPVPLPALHITRSNADTALLTWPVTAGLVLQSDTNVPGTNWQLVTTTPNVANGSNQVPVPLLPPERYFRLLQP